MSFQTYNRNAKSLVFFGDAGSDALHDSNVNLTFGDGHANALQIPDGGYIGSQSDFDAISIASNGNVSLTKDLTVTGNLTVNGTTTTVNTTNLAVTDSLIELSQGAGSATNDAGLLSSVVALAITQLLSGTKVLTGLLLVQLQALGLALAI